MSNEQWIVYLYGIYPEGGWTVLWAIIAVGWVFLLALLFIIKTENYDSTDKESCWHVSQSPWAKLGRYKQGITALLFSLIILSNLIPNKTTFLYLLATPYTIETGKTIIEQLGDKSSKIYKLNKLIDQSLDNAINKIEKEKK